MLGSGNSLPLGKVLYVVQSGIVKVSARVFFYLILLSFVFVFVVQSGIVKVSARVWLLSGCGFYKLGVTWCACLVCLVTHVVSNVWRASWLGVQLGNVLYVVQSGMLKVSPEGT
jgi:hypothetical protein